MKTTQQIMTTKLKAVQEKEFLFKAFNMMNDHKIRHLPVVNSKGEVTGILSDRDVLRAASSNIVYDHDFVFEKLELDPNLLVLEYMTTPALSLPKDTPIKDVAAKMIERKISSFLITDGHDVVGIVTTEDLLKLLTHMVSESGSKWQYNLSSILTNPLFGKVSQSISDAGL